MLTLSPEKVPTVVRERLDLQLIKFSLLDRSFHALSFFARFIFWQYLSFGFARINPFS